MTWEEALVQLGNACPVYREAWGEDDDAYLDSAFCGSQPCGSQEYPYTTANGSRFQVRRYENGDDENGMFYVLSEQDKEATDWAVA